MRRCTEILNVLNGQFDEVTIAGDDAGMGKGSCDVSHISSKECCCNVLEQEDVARADELLMTSLWQAVLLVGIRLTADC